MAMGSHIVKSQNPRFPYQTARGAVYIDPEREL